MKQPPFLPTTPERVAIESLASTTWHGLEDAYELDVSFSEETITDILALGLRRYRVHSFRILQTPKPREHTTGTDWEWWIGSVRHGWLRYGVQAKRLHVATQRYNSLAHTDQVTQRRQIDILMAYCGATQSVPIYCLYNYVPRAHAHAWHCGLPIQSEQLGCTIAPAPVIQKALSTRGGRTFASIHGDSRCLPWRCLVTCPDLLRLYDPGSRDASGRLRLLPAPPRGPSGPTTPGGTPESFGGWLRSISARIFPDLPAEFNTATNALTIERWTDDYYGATTLRPRRVLVVKLGGSNE
jgi:hypothetical protein